MSCSSKWHLRQIGTWDGSRRRRYWWRGWLPDHRRAGSTSSFWFFFCFESRGAFWCWWTSAIRSCAGGSSQIISFTTCMELEKETGRIVLEAMLMVCLPALSANSLPGMTESPRNHWIKMKDEMGLMKLWIEEVRGFDQMRASRNDLLSVQRSIVVEGWLALMDAQDNADSMAAASSL